MILEIPGIKVSRELAWRQDDFVNCQNLFVFNNAMPNDAVPSKSLSCCSVQYLQIGEAEGAWACEGSEVAAYL